MNAQLISLIFLLIGGFGGYKIASNHKPEPVVDSQQENYKQKYLSLKNKFQSLSESEIESYINEDDLSLKTKKADEMLAKLLKLFLVDVGLRLEEQSQRLSESKSRKKVKPKPSVVTKTVPNKISSKENKCLINKTVCEKRFGAFAENEESKDWRRLEARVGQISTSEGANDFLDSVAVKNLFSDLKSLSPVDKIVYMRLVGNYSGEVFFDNKSKENQEVIFSLKKVRLDRNDVYGSFKFQLLKDGEPSSSSLSDGKLSFLKTFDKQSKGFSIQLGRYYFHMYMGVSRKILFANVYERAGVTNYLKVGRAILFKK